MSSATMPFDLSPSPAPLSFLNPEPETFHISIASKIVFILLVVLFLFFCLFPRERRQQQQQGQLRLRIPRARTTPPTATTINTDHKSSQQTITFTYESPATIPVGKPLLSGRPAVDGVHLCCICLEDFKVGDECRVLVGCNHVYHKPCVDPWLDIKKRCPLCRGRVSGAFSKDLNAIV